LAEDRAAVTAGIAAGKRAILPFPHTTISSSAEEQLQCARIWVAQDCPKAPALWRGERYRHDKIRLAYVSADFHAHATAHLMAGVFEAHNRDRFEINAISLGPDDTGELRSRLLASFDRFIDVRQKTDQEAAAIIRQLETDIAVDLKGYTLNHRAEIFVHRPAPIQASYLGYPGTMGGDFIDYIIADKIVLPDEQRAYYTENIAYLPDTYQCNDSKRRIADTTPKRTDAGLPEQGFVFCCFNNNYKIMPEMFDIWMRLLCAIEGSVLWLLEDNPAAARGLRREAEARGLAPERLVFAPRMPSAEHLARHRLADLFLDTLPYGAHTTASDALWAGLPVLTCKGTTFAGRVASSLLSAAGMPETSVNSLADYEAEALRLARDKPALAALKAKLARTRDTCPLFDTARFTRNLEAAFQTMVERQNRGERPTTFAVEVTP
jgi:predicted O-linked N-acetylglucosamine transferase (SPINDLY family)